MRTVLCLLLLMIAGCGPTLYVRPGGTNQQFQHDQNDCLVKANQAGYRGGDFGSNIARSNFIQQCLYGMGWVKQ